MRILQFTAGAANMYCGSCLRDNTLAAALKRQGHDVLLMPVYTPTLTDEENVSEKHVLFGGISVYLQQKSAVFRHTPRFLDKLWDSRAALRLASKTSLPTSARMLGELTVAMLEGERGPLRKEFRKLREWLRDTPRPDLVMVPYTLLIALAGPAREEFGCPVICSLQGEDLFLDGLIEPYRSRAFSLITEHLPQIDRFFAVSEYYARFMPRYLGLEADRIDVTPLGVPFDDFPTRPRERPEGAAFRIGYLARVAPEKGLHSLCEAYHRMLQRPDRPEGPPPLLEAAGYLGAEHVAYLQGVERTMAGRGHVLRYHGPLDRRQKIDFLSSLDVLCVPTGYVEPKGLFVLEALACGVPVVQPAHGAFPEMLQRTGGGVLVPPGDADALAAALLNLWRDPVQTAALGRAGFDGVRRHYSVERSAQRVLDACAALVR